MELQVRQTGVERVDLVAGVALAVHILRAPGDDGVVRVDGGGGGGGVVERRDLPGAQAPPGGGEAGERLLSAGGVEGEAGGGGVRLTGMGSWVAVLLGRAGEVVGAWRGDAGFPEHAGMEGHGGSVVDRGVFG